MSVLDWKTYMEACEEIQGKLFRLKMQMERLTKLLEENKLVDLTQLEADKSVKEDILRRTKIFINRILEGEAKDDGK